MSADTDRWNRALLAWRGGPALRRRERATSRRRGFVYLDAGKVRVIDLKLRPRLMSREQVTLLSHIAACIGAVQLRVAHAWLHDPRLQMALPFTEQEHAFWRDVARSPLSFRPPVVSRMDASLAFDRPTWRHDLRLFELNSVGVGGLGLTPLGQDVVVDVCLPALRRIAGPVRCRRGPDTRVLLLRTLKAYAASLGIRSPVFGFVEDRAEEDGTKEYDGFVRYFRNGGCRARVGDVRDLSVDGCRLLLAGSPVDLVYRDTEMKDLFALRGAATGREAMKQGLAAGRVVSGIAGELDHKSLWEVFTDGSFARYLRPLERRLLGRHALWTRLLYPRRTADERGRTTDVERLVRRGRERYVLKPNREYGGRGVTVGIDTTAKAWDRAVDGAMARPGTWVVQALAEVMTEEFPVYGPDGEARLVRDFVDCGVYRVGDGYGILSRAAARRVVNVSAGGGLAAVLFD